MRCYFPSIIFFGKCQYKIYSWSKDILFKKEDGWNEYVVHVMENDVEKLMYYQDPLQALATLFSSSQVAFGFHIHPATPNNSQTYSIPNLAQWWLIRHVRWLSLLLTFFLMMTLCSCFDFFGFILEQNWLHSERVSFFGYSMHLEFVKTYKLWGRLHCTINFLWCSNYIVKWRKGHWIFTHVIPL